MVFSSFEFLFIFLPITLAGFWLVSFANNRILRTIWLIACSLFFYAFWSPIYIILLLVSIGINFGIAKTLLKNKKLFWLNIGIFWNIGLLGYYKYTNFFLETVAHFQQESFMPLHIILPLGISFFTFQQIAFLVDVYQRKITEIYFFEYVLFVSFFPQLIAGPIVHHKQIMNQFRDASTVRMHSKNIAIGFTILLLGLAKKTILADSLAPFANSVFAAAEMGSVPFYEAWGGTLTYTMQLYFDFSGYIDMAIGIALLFGIRLPINFNSPYKALSISDFWRRWHITLSNFLRNYIYIPLGGNRKGQTRTLLNLSLTMAIGGLWHGANWTFVLWGVLHGLFLIIHHMWRKLQKPLPKIAAWSTTAFAVLVTWSIFRAESLTGATNMLQGMLLPSSVSLDVYTEQVRIWLAKDIAGIRFPEWLYGTIWLTLATSITLFAPNTSQIMNYKTEVELHPTRWSWKPNVMFAMCMAILTIVSLVFLALYQKQEFLYFQF